MCALTLAYAEHSRPSRRTYTLCRWPTVFPSFVLSIFHFHLGAAFHEVCFVACRPFLWRIEHSLVDCQHP